MGRNRNGKTKPTVRRGGLDPASEDSYWRDNYARRPYVPAGAAYDTLQPAYRFGWEARGRYGELNWEAAEPQLRRDWDDDHGDSSLDWEQARGAARDAWDRIGPDVDYSRENR